MPPQSKSLSYASVVGIIGEFVLTVCQRATKLPVFIFQPYLPQVMCTTFQYLTVSCICVWNFNKLLWSINRGKWKAGSCWDSNPGHLWLELPVLCMPLSHVSWTTTKPHNLVYATEAFTTYMHISLMHNSSFTHTHQLTWRSALLTSQPSVYKTAMFSSNKSSQHNSYSKIQYRLSTAHALHSFCIQDRPNCHAQ